ncbi:MAG: hypothetical protein U0W24_14965 [Bacteroidales bacterium]
MNIEQIVSLIEGNAPYDQRTLSQVMILLEKYPYFQTGHMLLLKTMHQVKSENYNNQLRISGGFISDKRKLFQLINSEVATVQEKEIIKTEVKTNEISPVDKTRVTVTPEKKTVELPDNKIVKTEDKEKKTVIVPEINVEKEKDLTEKIIDDIKITTKIEEKEISQLTKKEELKEDEFIKHADESSKRKHKEIIKDFFQTTHRQSIEKKVIDPEKENVKKTDEIKKEKIKEEISKKVELNSEKKQEPVFVKKEEAEKTPVTEKVQEINKIKETKEVKEAELHKNLTEKSEIKEEKVNLQVTNEEKTEVEKEIKEEPSKSEIIKKRNLETSKSEGGTSEVMNSIFSKIRQIKKEMNITSENTPETIDIEPENERIRFAKTTKTEEKKSSGKLIKESFIGFNENEVIKEKTKETESEEETEQIKELGITAKELFKQHLKNKELTGLTEKNKSTEKSESEKTSGLSPISKVVANLNEEKKLVKDETVVSEPVKTESEIPDLTKEEPEIKIEKNLQIKEEDTKLKSEIKKVEEKEVKSTTTTAAELMLKRIEEKKRKMQEEKDKEKEDQNKITSETIEENKIKDKVLEETDETLDTNKEKNDQGITETKIQETVDLKPKKSTKLIDSFIENAENIGKIGIKETTFEGDISISSADEKEEFMTETMADIQIQQKNYEKAIEIYKKLILKFPEKKTYFAIQIKKTESLLKS